MLLMLDQEFTSAMQATVYPISRSSVVLVMAAMVGGDTQLGWPRCSEYSEETLD